MNKNELSAVLENKLDSLHHNSGLLYLRELPDLNEVIDTTLLLVHTALLKRTPLTGLASSVGYLCNRLVNRQADTTEAIRAGLFVLETFSGLLNIRLERIKKGAKGKTYFVHILEHDLYESLLETVDFSRVSSAVLPKQNTPEDWTGMLNDGIPLIRGGVVKLTPEDAPLVFGALNKLQSQGMVVNRPVLDIYNYLMTHRKSYKGTYAMSWHNPTKKKSSKKGKRLEAVLLQKVANEFKDKVFYSVWNLDFRGRMYPVSSFLNFQSSDASKGLLKSSEAKPLGEHGYKHLLIHTANAYGVDKVSVSERIDWVISNFDSILSWARDPLRNTEWMKASEPWVFLASIFEIKDVNEWEGSISDYPCSLFVASDGSCNGSQWQAALARDEDTAAKVNLKASTVNDTPEDLYSYIARYVFATVEQEALKMQHKQDRFNELYAQALVFEEYDSDKRPPEYYTFQEQYFKELCDLAPLFWVKVTAASEQRKLVKRNVMTTSYNVSRFGCGEQVEEDSPDVVDGVIKPFAVWFGSTVYDECRRRMPLAMSVIGYFEEQATIANDANKPYRFTTPNGFTMVQTYYKTVTKQKDFNWLDQRIQLRVNTGDKPRLNKKKQIAAASPNVVHSLDACHQQRTITAVEYPTQAIHDSFLSLPCDMEDYHNVIRREFVQLIEELDFKGLSKGTFNVSEVLDSTYSFI